MLKAAGWMLPFLAVLHSSERNIIQAQLCYLITLLATDLMSYSKLHSYAQAPYLWSKAKMSSDWMGVLVTSLHKGKQTNFIKYSVPPQSSGGQIIIYSPRGAPASVLTLMIKLI